MRSHSSIEIRRCRPLLGTFVEVATSGSSAADLDHGISAAFAAIEKVQRLMSFHNPASDVSRINRGAFPKSVIVHPWTWKVLKAAQQFARESDGVFDIAIARCLADWGYLPERGYRLDGAATWRDVFLRKNYRVFFRRPLIVDLGGIAKGFAVDQAVAALKETGATSGIVNAGGDLCVFGSASQVVHLRHPSRPAQVAGAVRLRERAMATSGIYFARRKYRGRSVSPIVDGRTGRSLRELISVSVAASDCMTADVLTKILFVLREKAAGLLAHYHADGLLLERDGAPSWMFHSSCDTRDRTRFD
jgi:thiamine biosynthesis lipoprotein